MCGVFHLLRLALHGRFLWNSSDCGPSRLGLNVAWISAALTRTERPSRSICPRSYFALATLSMSGLIVPPDPAINTHRKLIVGLTNRYQLPTIYALRTATAEGGLISYGVDVPDLFRKAAVYVDRILRGEKPGDLPVQQPTMFELVINLKAAKALGLDVPPTLLARADEVVE